MLRLLSLLFIASFLSACSSPRLAGIDDLSDLTNQVLSSFGNDSEKALTAANQAYDTAQREELEFYAPLHMQRIKDAMTEVQRNDLAGNNDALLASSALLQGLLKTALENKQDVQETLSPLIAQNAVLLEIHADKALPVEYTDAMEDMSYLIKLIEAGEKVRAIKRSPSVLQELTELEPMTMLAVHWQPAQQTLQKAEDEDADSTAPLTFAAARDRVEDARLTISEQYQDRELGRKAGLRALRTAQHALYMGRAAEKLQGLTAVQAEQKALDFESYLHDISSAIGGEDLRHMDLRDQALAIIQAIRERERQYQRALNSGADITLQLPPQTDTGAETEATSDKTQNVFFGDSDEDGEQTEGVKAAADAGTAESTIESESAENSTDADNENQD
ncbi:MULTISPECIES: hypothetical protein [unclassified Thalassolituus]|uniref:hypothetical protein n=1 Tax=unclassified Thalassolituus TaxID=2624967 RepID=UPI0025DBC22C|nr:MULTISPECIES: hypothetical protein [unclassified Thalassolituus]